MTRCRGSFGGRTGSRTDGKGTRETGYQMGRVEGDEGEQGGLGEEIPRRGNHEGIVQGGEDYLDNPVNLRNETLIGGKLDEWR